MRVVPKQVGRNIGFYETRVPKWLADPEAIGTTPVLASAMQTKTTVARDAFKAQQAAQLAARSATQALKIAMEDMNTTGSAIIGQIRAKAAMAGKSVYPLARIRVPKDPAPIAAPGKPTGFSFELQQIGCLELKWKCRNPAGAQGTVYEVYRREGFDGQFKFLGVSGKRKYVDTTLPAGVASVAYQIIAVRSTARGPAAQFDVNFGVTPGTARMLAVAMKTRIAA